MPRLLPRLLDALRYSRPPSAPVNIVEIRHRRKRLVTSQAPPECPSLSPKDRTQSIVLDSLDSILSLSNYHRHKASPPRLRVYKSKRRIADPTTQDARPRAMNSEERVLWSSPYLRMLATPLRQCYVSKRYLPKAFLIRIRPARLPASSTMKGSPIIVPSNLEHPSFRPHQGGVGTYVICRKTAVEQLSERMLHKRLVQNGKIHQWISQQIGHQLRVRVLQELSVLANHLRRRSRGAKDTPLIRRLTRAEWSQVKSSGILPIEDAVAVLVVPPLNRNPTTKARPEPTMSSAPPVGDAPIKDIHPSLPVATMLVAGSIEASDETPDALSSVLPQHKVPLYNGVSLFPSASQRAALHASLLRLLTIERQARYKEQAWKTTIVQGSNGPQSAGNEKTNETSSSRRDQKSSHAFLIRSNAKTLSRADTVPLAIALWRVRIWEGEGWDGIDGGGWGD